MKLAAVFEADSALLSEERRKLSVVDSEFQRRYSLLFLCSGFLTAIIFIGSFWFAADLVFRTLHDVGLSNEHPAFQLIRHQVYLSLYLVMGAVAVLTIFIWYISRYVTLRIAGPMFAIKRALRAALDGDWKNSQVRLRSEDEFKDIEALVNQVTSNIQVLCKESANASND